MATITRHRLRSGRLVERIRIKFAHECEPCADCGEPFCTDCQRHYAECECLGPSNAHEQGWTIVKRRGVLYGERDAKCPTK